MPDLTNTQSFCNRQYKLISTLSCLFRNIDMRKRIYTTNVAASYDPHPRSSISDDLHGACICPGNDIVYSRNVASREIY